MKFALVFYFNQKEFPFPDEDTFFHNLYPLFLSLDKQHINCYYLSETDTCSKLYHIQKESCGTPSLCVTYITKFEDLEYIYKFTGSTKSSLLFVSNSQILLQKLHQQNHYCVGFSHKGQFLPGAYCFESLENVDFTYFSEIMHRYQNKPLPIAKTKHLYIREFTTWDLRNLYQLYTDTQNTKYLFHNVPSYEAFFEQKCAYIEKVYPFYGFGLWGVFLKETNELIGEFGIQQNTINEKEEYEAGYLLTPSHQGKGYGKEALRAILRYAKFHLELDRIVARIHAQNQSSILLALNCGFTYETSYKESGENFLLFSLSPKSDSLHPKTVLHNQNDPCNISQSVYKSYQKQGNSFVYEKKYSGYKPGN